MAQKVIIEKYEKINGIYQVKYPFHKLKIGNSFFIKIDKKSKLKSGKNTYSMIQNIHNSLRTYVFLNLVHYRIKATQKENGVRVWRIQ